MGDNRVLINQGTGVPIKARTTPEGDYQQVIVLGLPDQDADVPDLLPSDADANVDTLALVARQQAWDATGSGQWARLRTYSDRTLLSSSARTATNQTADQANHVHRALTLWLDITASPNNTETLTVSVQGKDPVSGKYVALASFTALTASNVGATPTTATFALVMDPVQAAVALTGTGGGRQVVQARPTRTWRVNVAHSSTGSWTYSLGVSSN